jgi:diguanylate cyclase (GGDEF)-like protein
VFNDVTELKEAEEKLTRLAHHDPLTGLPNRNLFFDRLEHALHDAKRHGRIFALLYLDLDKFKPINDTLGHEFGDQALREVSQRLNKTLRSDDTVARVGGDEFIIILNGLPDSAATEPLAEKVVKAVLAPLKMGSLTHQLGASVGISMFPRDGKDMDTLICQADKAMYAAKKSGGNGYCSVGGSYVCCEEQQQNSPSC